jgi:GNAT superfamily N-acetyltransferase
MTADPATGDLRILDLAHQPNRDDLLEQMYREILIPSFRADELDPIEVTASQLGEKPRLRDVAAVVDNSGAVLGAAIGDWAPDSRVYLLSYLAVRPGTRSRGVGTRLFHQVQSWWRERGALLALAEVDDPRCYAVSAAGDPSARLVFYERVGAQVLDLPYFQPRLTPGGERVHGMLLLALGIHPDALVEPQTPVVRGDLLCAFLHRYLDETEGTTDDDPERVRLLDRASTEPGVRLLPVERYTEVSIDVAIPGCSP